VGDIQGVTVSGAVTDVYQRLSDVVGLNAQRMEFVEGFVTFQAFGGTTVYWPQGAPPSGTVGAQWAAGSGFGLGPRATKGAGWRADYVWVKNTTPGSVSTVVVTGNLEVL
jgi:hypothetical protein